MTWHFIGPIQSNKTRAIAEHFQWVHSIEREKIAARLNEARPAHLPPLDVCIQVNVSGEGSKSGVAPGAELALARAVIALPRLRLRGLMAIPEPTTDIQLQRRRFALLREIRDKLAAAGIALDTLSMGMSDDFEAAIAEGATMVRVGTAIFGQTDKEDLNRQGRQERQENRIQNIENTQSRTVGNQAQAVYHLWNRCTLMS